MSGQATEQTTGWTEADAKEWVERDRGNDQFAMPWKLAAAIAAHEGDVKRVLDVASGPGGFIGTVLSELPEATGVWYDFSETMRDDAMKNLAGLGGRVEYCLGDMLELDKAGPPESFDLVTTSRATHHLRTADLGKFYELAASRLRVGGWVANIDTCNPGEPWRTRLSELRRKLRGGERREGSSNHPHLHPIPSLEDHLAGMRAAGFDTPQVAWQSLQQHLIMAQKLPYPDPIA